MSDDNMANGIMPELLTTKQTAKLLGLGERTLWRYSRSGLAPAPVKVGIALALAGGALVVVSLILDRVKDAAHEENLSD